MTDSPVAPSLSPAAGPASSGAGSHRFRHARDYLAFIPFYAYVGVFLILPTLIVAIGAFSSPGGLTLDNISLIFTSDVFVDAFVKSIQLAVATRSRVRSSAACSPGRSCEATRTGCSVSS